MDAKTEELYYASNLVFIQSWLNLKKKDFALFLEMSADLLGKHQAGTVPPVTTLLKTLKTLKKIIPWLNLEILISTDISKEFDDRNYFQKFSRELDGAIDKESTPGVNLNVLSAQLINDPTNNESNLAKEVAEELFSDANFQARLKNHLTDLAKTT